MMDTELLETPENKEPPDGINNKLINLTLLNGTGYVFDADDYMQLRRQHRILGILVGSCGWSVEENTLPVELTTWETRLLVEQNIAQLVSKTSTLMDPPTAEQLTKYAQTTSILADEQMKAFKLKKLQETQRNMKEILAGKRRKLNHGDMTSEELDEETVLKAVADNFVYDKKFLLSQTHCAHPEPHRGQLCKITEDFSLIYCVFRDCWRRGYYVMSGETFGADFLLYPGDPLIYHASHMVILLESKGTISALELIAKARMSVFVNKICLFAYFAQTSDHDGEQNRKVEYQTVEWQGDMEEGAFDDDDS